MDSAAVLRSFSYSASAVSHVRSVLERPCMVAAHNATWPTISRSHIQGAAFSEKLVSNPVKRGGMIVSCLKKSETTGAVKSDDSQPQGSLEMNYLQRATFPNGLEALVMEVCDETEVAELKLKVGDFEMHLKRNVGVTEAPMPVASSTPPPPESSPASPPPPPPPRSSTEKNNPFTNVCAQKSAKLPALEASGTSGYVLVLSKTVGSFRRSRTVKGNKRPPICEVGDLIKEGQVIAYVEECGTELPVKSDMAGEVLKLLFDEGEAVGYGDPIVAVLPSFHGIE
ncbi:Biotin carboxyl carrier protein of acetyl-CoA carboxylase [Actinidia chinensis var. chinensis]|uniref:Biotin carboxyl carrier protein of acetyl-CoA carboxylase n=1 Tax=Actinidia chinensis var. chinensis TaxID=1590841 RepID=A0A2R6RTB2_ACTCC|nr:Biotin carboxyl carrier protein of acetyl-CoA carboxylase [Actinidia chinensis var. chinensis]